MPWLRLVPVQELLDPLVDDPRDPGHGGGPMQGMGRPPGTRIPPWSPGTRQASVKNSDKMEAHGVQGGGRWLPGGRRPRAGAGRGGRARLRQHPECAVLVRAARGSDPTRAQRRRACIAVPTAFLDRCSERRCAPGFAWKHVQANVQARDGERLPGRSMFTPPVRSSPSFAGGGRDPERHMIGYPERRSRIGPPPARRCGSCAGPSAVPAPESHSNES